MMTPMMTIKKQQWWRERWPRGRWWEPWQRLWSHFVSYDGYISLSKSDRNLNPLTDLRDFHHSGRWQKKKSSKVRRCDVIYHDREDALGVEVSENSQVVSSHHSSCLSRLWPYWVETVTISFQFFIKSAIGHRLSATSGLFTGVVSIKSHLES